MGLGQKTLRYCVKCRLIKGKEKCKSDKFQFLEITIVIITWKKLKTDGLT